MKHIGDFFMVFIVGIFIICIIRLILESPITLLIILIIVGVIAAVIDNIDDKD